MSGGYQRTLVPYTFAPQTPEDRTRLALVVTRVQELVLEERAMRDITRAMLLVVNSCDSDRYFRW